MRGTNACVIAADGGRARLFVAVPDGESQSGLSLVERECFVNSEYRARGPNVASQAKVERVTNRDAGDVHPISARRDQHRLELERRFAREITRRAAAITQGWEGGSVVLVAEPRMLGLLREPLRKVLKQGIELKELAKDYSQFTAIELRDRLALNDLITGPRSGA